MLDDPRKLTISELIETYKNVSEEDIRRVIRTYIHPQNMMISVLGRKEEMDIEYTRTLF